MNFSVNCKTDLRGLHARLISVLTEEGLWVTFIYMKAKV